MSHPPKQIGKYIYSPLSLLGKGSYSHVYLGQDQETSLPVAIKVIENHLLKTSSILALITQECEILRSLHHENIVKLHDILTTPHHTYIIQEYCNSQDLRKQLESQKVFSESSAVLILSQILQGYKELLQHNIMHRDLKPANILISDNHYKIADFGFATPVQELDCSIPQASLAGTPLYMSPQCLRGEPYCTKTDIWSLGIILYELIFGDVPWPANSRFELLQAFKTQPLSFPKERHTSALLQDFVRKCLAFEEKNRVDWEGVYKHPLFRDKKLQENMVFCRNRRKELVSVELRQHNQESIMQFFEVFQRVCEETEELGGVSAFSQEKMQVFRGIAATFAHDLIEKFTDKENQAGFVEKTKEIQRKKQFFANIVKKMREKLREIEKNGEFVAENGASVKELLVNIAKKLILQGNHTIFVEIFAEKRENTLKTHEKALNFLSLLLGLLGFLRENQGDVRKTLEIRKLSDFFCESREFSLENYKKLREKLFFI